MFLERRFESEDGTRAISVLRRTDNSYQFRIDHLRPGDAERDAFWVDGHRLSGLYESADDAESAARLNDEWCVQLKISVKPQLAPLTNFFELLTDPNAGIRSQELIDWKTCRAANRAGPFIASHLPTLGLHYTSLGSGFPRDAPPDRILYKLNPKRRVRDFETLGGFWVISKPAREVLVKYALDSIDLAPAQVLLRGKDGKEIATPPRFLCDVIRFEDVVDEPASRIQWHSGKQYGVGSLFAFKTDLPSNLHLFRLWKGPHTIVCSAELRRALEAIDLRGVAFGRLDIQEED